MFRGCASLTFDRNSPAAASETASLSSAASALPAPFCFLGPISPRFQIPSRPLPSCSDLQRGALATRVPRPDADIPIASAPDPHILSSIVRLPPGSPSSCLAQQPGKTSLSPRRPPHAPRLPTPPAATTAPCVF